MRELKCEELQKVSGGSLVNINSIDFNLAVTSAFSQSGNVALQPIGIIAPWSPGEGMGGRGGVSGEREES